MSKHIKSLSYTAVAAILCAVGSPAAAEIDNPSGSQLFGFLGWSDPNNEAHAPGFYQLGTDATYEIIWPDATFGATSSYFTSGWLRNNRLCGTFGNRSQLFYLEFDPATGTCTGQRELDIDGPNAYKYMYTSAYNTQDDYIYGFSFNEDLSQDYFVRAPGWDRDAVEIIREMPVSNTLCASFCYNPTDNHFYGVDLYGWLVRIDTRGNFEDLEEVYFDDMEIAPLANWSSGMMYSPKDRAFFWNANLSNFDSHLIRILPGSYECEWIAEYPLYDLYTFMCTLDDERDSNGADAPALVGTTLTGGNRSGSVSFKMPTQAGYLTALPSMLEWTAMDGDTVTATGTAEPGETVTTFFSDLCEGEHTLKIQASHDGTKGAFLYLNLWAGTDSPALVREINLSAADNPAKLQLQWQPVTEGAHGGYIDPSQVAYGVFIGEEQVAATSATSCLIDLNPDWPLQTLRAMVVAVYDGRNSDAAYSNPYTVGTGLELPYAAQPTAADWSMMTTYCDSGESAWTTQNDFSGQLSLFIPTSGDTATDDWVFTPGLNIRNTEVKQLYKVMAGGNSNLRKEEYLQLWIGTEPSPEAMTTPVTDRTQIDQIAQKELSGLAAVPSAGVYYLGIHCTSSPKMSGIYVNSIEAEDTAEPSSVTLNHCSAPSAVGLKGAVALRNLQGENVCVAAADGTLHYNGTPDDKVVIIPLPTGVYAVKTAHNTFKTIVK